MDKRNMVIYTGHKGAMMIDNAITEHYLLGVVKNLKKITKEEKASLVEMIKSPDKDNMELAKIIIEQKYEINKCCFNTK